MTRDQHKAGAVGLGVVGVLALVGASLLWPPTTEPAAAGSRPAPEVESRASQNGDVAPDVNSIGSVEEPLLAPSPDDGAERLATTSARLEDRTIERTPGPVGLRIDALQVSADVLGAGGLPNGEMEVPDNIHDVAWFEFGPSPGQPGSAVLAAHVDLAGAGPGVFFGLHKLERGDLVIVDYSDGSAATFEVVDGARYQKEQLDTDRIFSRSGPPVLTLITCGGAFNPSIGRYDSNVVVYAVPLADATGQPS